MDGLVERDIFSGVEDGSGEEVGKTEEKKVDVCSAMIPMVGEIPLEETKNDSMNEVKEALREVFRVIEEIRSGYVNANEKVDVTRFVIETLAKAVKDGTEENNELLKNVTTENNLMKDYMNEQLQKAFATLGNAVANIDTSNTLLQKCIADEVKKLNEENEKIVFGLGVEAVKKLHESLGEFENSLEKIAEEHRSVTAEVQAAHRVIVEDVRKVYQYDIYTRAGLWVWRWIMLVMMALLVQGVFHIEGLWGWFKVFSGLAVFF